MKHIPLLITVAVFLLGFSNSPAVGKVRLSTMNVGATYTQATKFSDDSVDHAENYGYSLELKIKPHKMIRIGFNFNYTPLQITEFDPRVAMTRTRWVTWATPYSIITSYKGLKNADGSPKYDIKWGYTTYYYNFEGLINLEITPISEGFFQPYISVGGGPSKYYTQAWIYSDWVLHLEGRYYHYPSRYFTNKRFRGIYWPVFAGAGFDLMFTKFLGFQAHARYFTIAKNHFRNRTNAYFRIQTGLVFHY